MSERIEVGQTAAEREEAIRGLTVNDRIEWRRRAAPADMADESGLWADEDEDLRTVHGESVRNGHGPLAWWCGGDPLCVLLAVIKGAPVAGETPAHTVVITVENYHGLSAAMRCDDHEECGLPEAFSWDSAANMENYSGDPITFEVPAQVTSSSEDEGVQWQPRGQLSKGAPVFDPQPGDVWGDPKNAADRAFHDASCGEDAWVISTLSTPGPRCTWGDGGDAEAAIRDNGWVLLVRDGKVQER